MHSQLQLLETQVAVGLELAGSHALLQSLAPAAVSPHVSHVNPALVQSEHASQKPPLPKSKLQKASPVKDDFR